jgi:putative ATPase
MEAPLAERIRPQKSSWFISQSHLVGPKGSLTNQIAKGITFTSYFGDHQNIKTTLAQIIAQQSQRPFFYRAIAG